MKRIAAIIISAALALSFIAYSKETLSGVSEAVGVCISVAIPSLFPMLFVSSYICESGAAQTLGRIFAPLFEHFFSLPGEAAGVFIMSILGGYPSGAATCAALYDKGVICRNTAQWLVTVCVCAGPGFLLSTVGGVYFGSLRAGLILYAAQILSLIAVCLIFRPPAHESFTRNAQITDSDNAFVSAALKASHSIISVCIFIILFGALLAVLDCTGLISLASYILTLIKIPPSTARALVLSTAEVTSGCAYAAKSGYAAAGFAVGFGGLSVHFQIFSIADKIKISRLRFFAARLIQGIVCSICAWLLSRLIITDEAISVAAVKITRALPDVTGSVLLLVLCVMFVLCAPQINRQSSRP